MCLAVLLAFTYARDRYRVPTHSAIVSKKIQLGMSVAACLNYIVVTVFINLDYSNNYLTYPWIASFLRPVIVVLLLRNVRTFWSRYFQVIKGSTPMVLFILIFVMYFAWMGQRLFAGTIEGV